MRLVKIFVLCVLSLQSFSQATLTGTVVPAPGTTQYYEAQFSTPLQTHTNISWYVSGGSIVTAVTNPTAPTIYCYVEWFNSAQPGYIEVYEDVGGQLGWLDVQIGTPNLIPAVQLFQFGSSAQSICVEVTALNKSFVWQRSPDGVNWQTVSGTDQCFGPTNITGLTYFRSIVTIGSTTFYTDAATVDFAPLQAGTISMSQQPNYNTSPAISNTPASGGLCIPANYQYTWEQSVEGGPWTAVGTSVGYPGGAPAIIGNTLIRRKITCGTETLYSNSLSVTPVYTPVDLENRNYIRTYTIATRGIQSRAQADQLEVGKKFQNTVYFDGLGRTIQVVDKGISQYPNDTWNDMVAFTEYNNQGRPKFNNLPYPTTDLPGKFKTSTAAQVTFYTSNFGETQPWGETEYENDAIGQIKKEIDPGTYRLANDIGKSFEYDFNNSGSTLEKVHIWKIGYTAGALPVTSTSVNDLYQTGTLVRTTIADETGKKVIVYKDFSGNIILKKVQLANTPTVEHDGWLCTYFVYDDFNQLRYIITPKAVAYLDANSWSLTQTIADELCYSYEYDLRGRTITKKTPGAARLNMVYDQRDRLVFTQDGIQAIKSPNEWSVNFYDETDRVIMTGIYKTNKTRSQLQTDLDNAGATTVITIPGAAIEHLVINKRDPVRYPFAYQARQSIEFIEGFETLPADNLVMEIDPSAVYPSMQLIVTLPGVPAVDISDPSKFTTLTFHFFDNYDFDEVKSFDNDYNNHQAYLPTDPDVEPIAKSNRTLGMPTGSKVRVLGSNTFLLSTTYYNEEGQIIQTISDNYKQGKDVLTNQYGFDGRVLSSQAKHYVPGGEFDGFSILTKNVYDKIGRLKTLFKKYAATDFKKIADYTFDELGHLKSRKLGKKPTTTDPLETINYSYNANGLLTGMNKDYALTTIDADQWNNYFGLYLGYENFDSKFTRARYDHLISGAIWKTQGDNTPRRYDFDYDNANRFTKAEFTQRNAPSIATWSNAQFDFSESDIQYDENGNLKQLYRKGVVPGNSTALYVDKLQYTYRTTGQWSNQLLKVFDNSPDIGATGNGKFGDFKDEVYNSDTDDYTFDVNGNLVKDNNKKIRNGGQNGIIYNHLDKVEKIIIENGSTVEYFYDALGIKLAKKVTPQSGPAKTTYFIGEFVYQENDLQFLLHEEGRVRIMMPEAINTASFQRVTTGNAQFNSTKWGVFEYFIKDHLGSVRMVLSEESHVEVFTCTMEDANATVEEQFFGKVDINGNPATDNEVSTTREGPTSWPGNNSKVSKLEGPYGAAPSSIGPNLLLKVMAGDYLTVSTNYYYQVPSGNLPSSSILSNIAASIVGGFTGGEASQAVKDAAAPIQTTLGSIGGPIAQFLTNRPGQDANRPKAYLNYIFFDENFNYVGTNSGAARVNPANNNSSINVPNIRAPKNGYAFVYLSNESDWTVYFDQFSVIHERSAIIEESHYYAHGLKIAGISSRSFNKMPNKYGFQGDFSENESESGYDEFDLRMYDQQIGRWIQNDPYDEFASGYVGMGNDPANNVDPDGGQIFSSWGQFLGTVIGAGVGYLVGNAIAENNGYRKNGWIPAVTTLLGAAMGYGAFELNWNNVFGDFTAVSMKFGELDFSHVIANNLAYFNYIKSNLEMITGLKLEVNASGKLGYQRHVGLFGIRNATVARFRTNSVYGRKLLKRMIKNPMAVAVLNTPGHAAGSHVNMHRSSPTDPWVGDNIVNMDVVQQTDINSKDFHGIDPNTLGPGMIFIHEYGHTQAGGSHRDRRTDASGNLYDNPQGGFNERPRKLNRIRRQMSGSGILSWGRRSTYHMPEIPVGSGNNYMGFDRKARKYILRGIIPPVSTKYFRWF